jgi:oligopeptide/dipeptide ABC transporter ATP-binding protein
VSRSPILRVRDLGVSFSSGSGSSARAVRNVSFDLYRNEILALVGESGSGKSVSIMSILGLTRGPHVQITGQAVFQGEDILHAPAHELRAIRGSKIALIPQNPLGSLNPARRIVDQVVEQVKTHQRISRAQAVEMTVELLGRVGIANAAQRAFAYPYQFSGGMRQRVMIAMALSCRPDVIIADEPTTALDVTVQAEILAELRRICDEEGTGLILVTHNLAAVAKVADRVAVMYAGQIVETGPTEAFFVDPRHPYTWGLIGSILRVDRRRPWPLATIKGGPPTLGDQANGCALAERCPHAYGECVRAPPLCSPTADEHLDRCWLPLESKRRLRQGPDGGIELRAAGPRSSG